MTETIKASIASIQAIDGHLKVSGELNFLTVMHVWHKSLPLLKKLHDLQFDFTEVKQCNSAALALLVEWLKYAKKHKKPIRFNALPQQLKSILAVSNVDGLFDA